MTDVEFAVFFARSSTQDPSDIATLLKLLKTGRPRDKCRAADLLGQLGDGAETSIPALVEALADGDCHELRHSIGAWDPDLESEYRYVRERAVRALARIRPLLVASAVIPVMSELVRCHSREYAYGGAVLGEVDYVHFSTEEVLAFGPAAASAMLEVYRTHPEPQAFAKDLQALVSSSQGSAEPPAAADRPHD
jgi:HEAT repeat protein